MSHCASPGRKISDLKKLKRVLETMAAQCTGGKVPECPVIDALFDTRMRLPLHLPSPVAEQPRSKRPLKRPA